ncbi:MAG: hypothetical protein ACOCUP_03500 [bacterium]
MKKITLSLIAVIMLLAFSPVKASAENHDNDKTEVAEVSTQEQADIMIDRLHKIVNMNIKSMDGPDKEKLRDEVLTIKDKLEQLNGGIYISAGALIIIIIILILL